MQLFLTFLTSRITQLTIRLITMICAAILGSDAVKSPDAVSAIEQGSSWLLMTVGGILLDLIIHSAQFGKLKTWWANYKAQGGSSIPSLWPMLIGFAMLAAVGLGGVLLGGCAQTETNRVAQNMIMVQTHASNAADLVNAGALTESQAKNVQAVVHGERDAVAAYYNAIQAGDSAAMAASKAALALAVQAAAAELAKYPLPHVTPIVLPALTQPER